MPNYKHLLNKKNCMDGIELLSLIEDGDVSCCFFDPQYRGIMEKMNYGNEEEYCSLTIFLLYGIIIIVNKRREYACTP